MSYRNPQIIVDRSAEIYAEGSAKFGQNLAQGVQNYFDKKKQDAEDTKKRKATYQLALNDISLEYEKKLNSSTEEIDESSLFKDVQDQARLKLDGDEINLGVIEMATQLKVNPNLDRDTRQAYTKAVAEYDVWENGIVNKTGAVMVDIEPLKNINAGNFAVAKTGFDFAGTGNDKFVNMGVAYTLDNKQIPGIKTNKKLNGKMLNVDLEIDTNNPRIQEYVNGGILDLDGLEVNDKGIATVNWTRNVDKWEGGLLVQVPDNFDSIKALETSGIIDSKTGLPKEGFMGEKKDRVVDVIGTDKQRVYSRTYFDPDLIDENTTFNVKAREYGAQLLQLTTGEQLSSLENNFSYKTNSKDWLSLNKEKQIEHIRRLIVDREVARLAPNFSKEQIGNTGEFRYFIENEGKLIEKSSKVVSDERQTQNKAAVENIEELDISSAFAEGPSQEPGRGVLNLNVLEKLVSRSPYNVNVSKDPETVGGEDTRKLTKSVEGADRSVTIFDSATDSEVKAALKFLETGTSFKPTENIQIDFKDYKGIDLLTVPGQ